MFTVGGSIRTSIINCLLEVLALLSYNYQGLLVFTERTNLLALRRNVILLERAVPETLSVENSGKESAVQKHGVIYITKESCFNLFDVILLNR